MRGERRFAERPPPNGTELAEVGDEAVVRRGGNDVPEAHVDMAVIRADGCRLGDEERVAAQAGDEIGRGAEFFVEFAGDGGAGILIRLDVTAGG